MVANCESSISISTPTVDSLEEIDQFIRTGFIRFDNDIQGEPRKNGDSLDTI